jgi:hypothetical protein
VRLQVTMTSASPCIAAARTWQSSRIALGHLGVHMHEHPQRGRWHGYRLGLLSVIHSPVQSGRRQVASGSRIWSGTGKDEKILAAGPSKRYTLPPQSNLERHITSGQKNQRVQAQKSRPARHSGGGVGEQSSPCQKQGGTATHSAALGFWLAAYGTVGIILARSRYGICLHTALGSAERAHPTTS